MEDNFGIPQISPYISNTKLFDGSADAAKAYAELVLAGKYNNIAGIAAKDKPETILAKIISFE